MTTPANRTGAAGVTGAANDVRSTRSCRRTYLNTQVNIAMSDLELARCAAFLLENGADAIEP